MELFLSSRSAAASLNPPQSLTVGRRRGGGVEPSRFPAALLWIRKREEQKGKKWGTEMEQRKVIGCESGSGEAETVQMIPRWSRPFRIAKIRPVAIKSLPLKIAMYSTEKKTSSVRIGTGGNWSLFLFGLWSSDLHKTKEKSMRDCIEAIVLFVNWCLRQLRRTVGGARTGRQRHVRRRGG